MDTGNFETRPHYRERRFGISVVLVKNSQKLNDIENNAWIVLYEEQCGAVKQKIRYSRHNVADFGNDAVYVQSWETEGSTEKKRMNSGETREKQLPLQGFDSKGEHFY